MEPVRASDAEREAVVDALTAAAGEGRLTLEELAERTEAVLTATSRAELEPLTADLPDVPAPPPGKVTRWVLGIFGAGDRSGRWRAGRRITVVNVLGGADLDLRQAIVEGPVTEITVWSLMGGSDIVVPEGVTVDAAGFAFLGADDVIVTGPPPPPGAPLVRVRSWSLMGGTEVATEPGPSRRRPVPPHPPAPPRPP